MLRAKLYAEVLEIMIVPDGSFPQIGPSITYRFGVFNELAQMVLIDNIPEKVSFEQIRVYPIINRMQTYC